MTVTLESESITSSSKKVEAPWKKCQRKYLTAIRGKVNMKHKLSDKQIKVRQLVMVNREYKQRSTWKIGKFKELFVGKDGIVRVARIKTTKEVEELYQLELQSDHTVKQHETEGKPGVAEWYQLSFFLLSPLF